MMTTTNIFEQEGHTCRDCSGRDDKGGKYVVRLKKNGDKFLGCSNYPMCKSTLNPIKPPKGMSAKAYKRKITRVHYLGNKDCF